MAFTRIIADLHSPEDAVRLKALELLGLSQQQAQVKYAGQVSVDGVEEVELRYASLGTDNANQAIIGAVLGPVVFGAVATRTKAGWTRIADFSCWCKYERGDLLAGFIQVERTGIEGAIVYESRFNVPLGNGMAQFFIPDIELRYARNLTCKTYKWNEVEFRYEEFSAPDPCKTGRFEP